MKLVKAETDVKPIPENHVIREDLLDGSDFSLRYKVIPITDNVNLPSTEVFNPKPRSYVFGVVVDDMTWFKVVFYSGEPVITFDVPGVAVHEMLRLDAPSVKVFLGYNDGFLGATFKDGFFSPKQRILYWYCVARTRSDVNISEYFYHNTDDFYPNVFNIESVLQAPVTVIPKPILIGEEGLRIGGGWHIGDNSNG